jgi:ATP10 protein
MHHISMILMVLMASSVMSMLSPGEPMPTLKGEFLTGRPALLPGAASGRVALLALGFTYNSRFAVEAWIGQFRKDFGGNPHATFYEVPMIGGMARLGKWFIDSGMRKGTPSEDHENVITVYGGTALWKQRLEFQSPDAAYLVLLDQRGVVRWRHSGVFKEEAYRGLSTQVSALLPGRQ